MGFKTINNHVFTYHLQTLNLIALISLLTSFVLMGIASALQVLKVRWFPALEASGAEHNVPD